MQRPDTTFPGTLSTVEWMLRRLLDESQRRMDTIGSDIPPENRAGRIMDEFVRLRDELRDLLWMMHAHQ